MRQGAESQGLLQQLSIELQELARVCRASIRDDKADIEILCMLSELRDEALLREVHREGAELNTKVPCDMLSDLIKQCLSPGHQREVDPGRRDLSCEFGAYPGRSPGDERPRPELLFIKQRFHAYSLSIRCCVVMVTSTAGSCRRLPPARRRRRTWIHRRRETPPRGRSRAGRRSA